MRVVEYDTCPVCGEPLETVRDNVGFSEPGAEKWEVVGFKPHDHSHDDYEPED